MKGDFSIQIGGPVDSNNFICEISYKDKFIAVITNETEILMMELHPDETNEYWTVPLEEFQSTIEYAKKHLLGEIL